VTPAAPMIDTKKLREIAEIARKESPTPWEFREAFDPPAVLALLDALEDAQRVRDQWCEEYTKARDERDSAIRSLPA